MSKRRRRTRPTSNRTLSRPLDAPSPATARLVARGPEDLLAMVPIMLGFEPTESVVLLTFPATGRPATRSFHARVDLPPDEESLVEVARALRAPVQRHAVDRLALVLVTEDAERATVVARHLAGTFADREVVALLRADGSRWWALDEQGDPVDVDGQPYDVGHHPFRAHAVVAGTVVAPNREAAVAAVAADVAAAGPVAWHLRAAVGPVPETGLRRSGEVVDVGAELDAVRSWVVALLLRAAHGGAPGRPTDPEVAQLAFVLHDPSVRDAAWWLLAEPGTTTARARLDAWCDLLRRTPAPVSPPVAVLTAAAALLAGQGALAVAALERCLVVDPGFPMADVVAEVVQRGVSPTEFRESLADCFGHVVPGARGA